MDIQKIEQYIAEGNELNEKIAKIIKDLGEQIQKLQWYTKLWSTNLCTSFFLFIFAPE